MINPRLTQEDRDILMHPDRWTLPYCCLKKPSDKPGAFPEFAFVLPENPLLLALHGIFAVFEGEKITRTKEYASFDELFEDGWIVD